MRPADTALAPDAAVDRFRAMLREIGIAREVERVLLQQGLSIGVVLGTGRLAHPTAARHWLMFSVRSITGWSYPALGGYFCRDHTTVIQGIQAYERAVRSGKAFAPVPVPARGLTDRDSILRFLQEIADEHSRKGRATVASEIDKVAGRIRREEDRE